MVTIAVDAMGGDFAPHEIVKGALLGAKRYGVDILLVGKPPAIEAELARQCTDHLNIEIVPSYEVIEMGEATVAALRKKKDASITVTARCVSEGRAQAMVAAGSTGAAMTAALFQIGRIPGIDRPAIGVVLPNLTSPTLLLDAGANADCTAEYLGQFAQMGSIFMSSVYKIPQPRVGLLNIGSEPGKGNVLSHEAFALLETVAGIHFIGNVEGRDLFLSDQVDVAVCDGFTGNTALKSAEGISIMVNKILKEAITAKWYRKIGGLLAKSAFDEAKRRVDPEEFGGALLLGIKGICVIAHGNSSANAIQNAIRVAKEAVDMKVLEKISQAERTVAAS